MVEGWREGEKERMIEGIGQMGYVHYREGWKERVRRMGREYREWRK